MLAEKTIYNALPKLPGLEFAELSRPADFSRRHLCYFEGGERKVKDVLPVAAESGPSTQQPGAGIPVHIILKCYPEWCTLDDKVLRYYGYYTEEVQNSTIERERIRRVRICLFLADGTVTVTEAPVGDNSGFRGGRTVSRHYEPGVDALSLHVGSVFQMRGITYHVVDCDAATRHFYDAVGIPQEGPETYPYDAFEAAATAPRKPIDEDHIELRRNMELRAARASGTHASLLTPEERTLARNYFDHDREVLQFNAVWDGREFRILYFVADGTMAVLNVHAPNSGRDPCAVFLRRERVPCGGEPLKTTAETLRVARGAPSVFVRDTDLRTGTTIRLFKRDFFIFDCDAFTRRYYERTYAIRQEPTARLLVKGDTHASSGRAASRTKTSTIDSGTRSAGACALQRSAIAPGEHDGRKRDALKLIRFTNDALRYTARFTAPSPGDEDRRFVVSYFLADDTVAVTESVAKNSGLLGGRVFSRSFVSDVSSPDKMFVGATLRLGGFSYTLLASDEWTQKYTQACSEGRGLNDKYFHVLAIVMRARQEVHSRFLRPSDALCHYASNPDVGLTYDDLTYLLQDCKVRCDGDDMVRAVFDYLDEDHDGLISVREFMERLLGEQFTANVNRAVGLGVTLSEYTAKSARLQKGPIRTLDALDSNRVNVERAEEVYSSFLSTAHVRRTLVMKVLQGVSSGTYDGRVGTDDFRGALQQMQIHLKPEDTDALVFKLFYIPGLVDWTKRRLSLKELKLLTDQ